MQQNKLILFIILGLILIAYTLFSTQEYDLNIFDYITALINHLAYPQFLK